MLIDLKGVGGRETDFFVIPRRVVAAIVYSTHRAWLSEPGQGGRVRNDSDMRAIRPERVDGYQERWDLLFEPPEAAPLLLDDSYRATIDRFGRPQDRALLVLNAPADGG